MTETRRVAITVADLRLGNEPLRMGEWGVEPGDSVDAGEVLAELICPGLSLELPAPATGIVVELCRAPEQTVHVGDIVGWIETTPTE